MITTQTLVFDEVVMISVQQGVVLTGHLTVPKDSKAIILFSGRHCMNTQNYYVAELFQQEKFATLLVDLLTDEEKQQDTPPDIDQLTDRLIAVRNWLEQNPCTEGLHIGLFGASRGVATAFKAVTKADGKISAIVSLEGRPDLSKPMPDQIKVPVLLLVGGRDQEVLKLNRELMQYLSEESALKVVEGTGRLSEEPGILEEVGIRARDWFLKTI